MYYRNQRNAVLIQLRQIIFVKCDFVKNISCYNLFKKINYVKNIRTAYFFFSKVNYFVSPDFFSETIRQLFQYWLSKSDTYSCDSQSCESEIFISSIILAISKINCWCFEYALQLVKDSCLNSKV